MFMKWVLEGNFSGILKWLNIKILVWISELALENSVEARLFVNIRLI